MSVSWKAAEAASFQSFVNCYMREVDKGQAVRHATPAGTIDCVEWVLQEDRLALRAEITSASLCGPHYFGRAFIRSLSEPRWHATQALPALQSLTREAYRRLNGPPSQALHGLETELLLRLMDSLQQMNLHIGRALERVAPVGGPIADGVMTDNVTAGETVAAPAVDSVDSEVFIEAEQSLVFGHWLHPTPKSRQGMSFWQQETYAPELHGQFQLQYFAARRSLVEQDSALAEPAEAMVRRIVGEDARNLGLEDGETLLPMHPLQAQALLVDADITALIGEKSLRSLGPAGPLFTATSSVRTIYSADVPWMLKFSLPVRITNSVRINGRHELDAGVAMTRLADRLQLDRELPSFRIIKDPAYITLALPGRRESGFETILRDNPFGTGRTSGVITLAALTADPLPGHTSRLARLIRNLDAVEGNGLSETARTWFRCYVATAVAPLVLLYDRHGLALEAHQQNSLVDVSGGYPRMGYYRDNQGFYLSERHRATISRLVPETETIGSLYFDDAEIRDRFAYYLIVNQVFSVISRMAHDGLADEAELLGVLRGEFEALALSTHGVGRAFLRHVLDEETIGTKANLTTRLIDVDELSSTAGHSLYSKMPNPLNLMQAASGGIAGTIAAKLAGSIVVNKEGPHAIAS